MVALVGPAASPSNFFWVGGTQDSDAKYRSTEGYMPVGLTTDEKPLESFQLHPMN